MANDTDFKQPELTSLTTKALQLDALRQVRSHDVTHFKKLQDQKTQINDAVRSLMGSRRHGNVNDNFPELENNQQPSSGPTYYQQNSSQAEQTMQRYKPNDRNNPDDRITQPDVPTEYNLSTGQLHPWNEERKYLSKFPISFCRCFICDNTDHKGLRDCPITKDGKYDKKKFFEELWNHKQHTKRPALSQDNGRNLVTYQHSQYNHNNQQYQHNQHNQYNQHYQYNQKYQKTQHSQHNKYNQQNQNNQHNQYNQHNLNNQNNQNNLNNDQPQLVLSIQGNNRTDTGHYSPRSNNNTSSGTGYSCGVNNTPHCLSKSWEGKSTKWQCLFLLLDAIFSTPSVSTTRAIPLEVDTKLSAIEMRFGTTDNNKIIPLCHLDSCANMYTASLLLHQWMITNHPEIVVSDEEYADSNPFVHLSWIILSQ